VPTISVTRTFFRENGDHTEDSLFDQRDNPIKKKKNIISIISIRISYIYFFLNSDFLPKVQNSNAWLFPPNLPARAHGCKLRTEFGNFGST
jgi:hypothetical protein